MEYILYILGLSSHLCVCETLIIAETQSDSDGLWGASSQKLIGSTSKSLSQLSQDMGF